MLRLDHNITSRNGAGNTAAALATFLCIGGTRAMVEHHSITKPLSRSLFVKGNTLAKGNPPNKTAFPQGHTPWNKGNRGIHLSPRTEFKHGQPSNNVLPLWTITQRRCKNNRQRHFIKTPARWVEYAKWLWIDSYGSLISGDVVHHLNGDSLDDTINNLIALPRTDHPVYHNKQGICSIPEEKLAYYRGRYAQPPTDYTGLPLFGGATP